MATISDTGAGDPGRDLVLTRSIAAPREVVWRAWTQAALLRQWWAPAPLTVVACEVDPRPGGVLRALMRDPDDVEYPGGGVFLELAEPRLIVFTDALEPGWRPAKNPFFTAVITLEPGARGGTEYTARALHKDATHRERHEQMGFREGWGSCIGQLAELAGRLARET